MALFIPSTFQRFPSYIQGNCWLPSEHLQCWYPAPNPCSVGANPDMMERLNAGRVHRPSVWIRFHQLDPPQNQHHPHQKQPPGSWTLQRAIRDHTPQHTLQWQRIIFIWSSLRIPRSGKLFYPVCVEPVLTLLIKQGNRAPEQEPGQAALWITP